MGKLGQSISPLLQSGTGLILDLGSWSRESWALGYPKSVLPLPPSQLKCSKQFGVIGFLDSSVLRSEVAVRPAGIRGSVMSYASLAQNFAWFPSVERYAENTKAQIS